MRFEGKSEQEAIEMALRELKRPASELEYSIVRDEKSFWGGRVVEIEVAGVEPGGPSGGETAKASPPPEVLRPDPVPAAPVAGPAGGWRGEEGEPEQRERGGPRSGSLGPGAMDEEAFAAVEATLTELLSAAGFLVETRRRPGEEMLFELIGDDTGPLLANRGEGLNGLEVLTGRLASKRLGRPVYPRLDAEGFRAHQRESLEELALRSANEAKRTKSPQLLPPLSPGERRLVHIALAADPEVETESEGDGFLKRVAVRPRAS
jgi:spoIIIJ-associated protein